MGQIFNYPPNTAGATQFVADGLTVSANIDTVVSTNSKGLPVVQLQADGTVYFPEDTTTLLTNIDGTLATISSHTPGVGQAAMAASSPVVIASDQSTLNVNDSSNGTTGAAAPSKASLSGFIDGSGNIVGLTLGAGNTLPISSSVLNTINGKIPSQGQAVMAGSTPVTIASDQSTLPVSAASLPLPTGAATESTLSTLNGKVPSNLTVTATRLLVDGSGVTQPVSAASLPLPTGAATESTLSTASGTLTTINGKIPNNGQALMAASIPVAIASNQSAFSVKITDGTDEIAVNTNGSINVIPGIPSASGAVNQQAITVGTTAVRLTVSGSAPNTTRRKLMFMADAASTGNFWFGGSAVANTGAQRGIPLFPGQAIEFKDDVNDYYIISDTAAQTVYVLEVQ